MKLNTMITSAVTGRIPLRAARVMQMGGLIGALVLTLPLMAAPAAPAAAGDASATAVQADLTGTVLGAPISLLDLTLSDVEVSQGGADEVATDTVLEVVIPGVGTVPLVSASVVSSTASSNDARATATSQLTDVSVDLGLPGLPTILTADVIETSALCPILGAPTTEVVPPLAVTLLGVPVTVVLEQDILVDIGIAQAVLRIGDTEVTTDTAHAVGFDLDILVDILGVASLDLDLVIAETMCERGVGSTAFDPFSLEVDFVPVASDGNGVFEPGEQADVAPGWLNATATATVAQGTASNLTGPAGPTYTLVFDDTDYGIVGAGASASCRATGVCYRLDIGPPGVTRPVRHWDATFDETLSDGSSYTWVVHLGDTFLDVPRPNIYYKFVENVLHQSITVGCTVDEFCPGASNTRAQMATFMLKAKEVDPNYVPPPCVSGSEIFNDVPASNIFCPWIEELFLRGVVNGCGGGNFCPNDSVRRAQSSVFLLKTLEGVGYTPPPCSGIFADVVCPSTFANWIEDLYLRGVSEGCGTSPLRYCPTEPLSRGEMSVFITKTFDLELYGP